jgi:putative membrane protein
MRGPPALAWWALRARTSGVVVEGLEHVPRAGPVLLVARHYHHVLDGAVLLRAVPRPIHVVVALDWAPNPRARRWMERACAWAQWPVILRSVEVANGAYAGASPLGYVRRGLRHAARLLAAGRVVAVFPEGYPAIDPSPHPRPARDAAGFLPFRPVVATLTRLAERAGARDLAVVPVGFRYAREGARWHIAARFGPAIDPAAPPAALEAAVRGLSV